MGEREYFLKENSLSLFLLWDLGAMQRESEHPSNVASGSTMIHEFIN